MVEGGHFCEVATLYHKDHNIEYNRSGVFTMTECDNSKYLTVCLLMICKGFRGISLQPGVVASWGFHPCYFTLLFKILAFLGQFGYIFTTIITKRSILIRLEA